MEQPNNIAEIVKNIDHTIVINILKQIERIIEKSTDIFSDAIEIKKSIESLKSDEQAVVLHLLTDVRKICLTKLEDIYQNKLDIKDDVDNVKIINLMQLYSQNKRIEEIIELILQSWDFIEQQQETARRFQKKMQSSAGCAQIIEPDKV